MSLRLPHGNRFAVAQPRLCADAKAIIYLLLTMVSAGIGDAELFAIRRQTTTAVLEMAPEAAALGQESS